MVNNELSEEPPPKPGEPLQHSRASGLLDGALCRRNIGRRKVVVVLSPTPGKFGVRFIHDSPLYENDETYYL
jgi:hypothetical protein